MLRLLLLPLLQQWPLAGFYLQQKQKREHCIVPGERGAERACLFFSEEETKKALLLALSLLEFCSKEESGSDFFLFHFAAAIVRQMKEQDH